MVSERVQQAVHDLRYLLNKGYPRESSVEFVSDHYLLESDKRHLLSRCVFPKEDIEDHLSRLVGSSEVRGKEVGIDGYNVLITVESILNKEKVILCDDGVVRDLQAIFGKYKMTKSTEKALKSIIKKLKEWEPERVEIFFDKQVSKSGELAGFTRKELDKQKITGSARTVTQTDSTVWEHEVSASSDRVIIKKSEKIIDIPSEFLKKTKTNLVDITKI